MNNNQLAIAPTVALAPNRERRRKAPTKHQDQVRLTRLAVGAVAALTAGVLFSGHAASEPAVTPDIIVTVTPAPSQTVSAVTDDCIYTPAPTQPSLILNSVPLGSDTQQAIYEMCGNDYSVFCTVMAIANRETGFNPDAIGDGGKSIGLMQINTKWQQDRIEQLGITDLTDPEQNVTVALDFLWWLANRLDPEHPYAMFGTNELFMAYNCGLQGTYRLWESGTKDTEYSRYCTATFQSYMAELGVTA